jgi:peptidoglycan/LPS O-acetylase OafA/YrhL
MLRLLRVVLLLVIAFVMVTGVVLGLANDTGPVEKIVLVAFGAVLVVAAVRVNRIGAVQR